MKNQSINSELTTYFSLLTPEQKNSVVEMIKSFLKTDEPKRISKTQYNKELEEAEKRVTEGKYYTEKEAEKMLSKW
ncbi:MAG: hypothetical protein WCO54_09850 [Bacteroidota bacterium]